MYIVNVWLDDEEPMAFGPFNEVETAREHALNWIKEYGYEIDDEGIGHFTNLPAFTLKQRYPDLIRIVMVLKVTK